MRFLGAAQQVKNRQEKDRNCRDVLEQLLTGEREGRARNDYAELFGALQPLLAAELSLLQKCF
jgi:hypothetical protein